MPETLALDLVASECPKLWKSDVKYWGDGAWQAGGSVNHPHLHVSNRGDYYLINVKGSLHKVSIEGICWFNTEVRQYLKLKEDDQ